MLLKRNTLKQLASVLNVDVIKVKFNIPEQHPY
jgi:hypothetical protein